MPVYFDQTPQQEVDDILQINIHGTLAITKLTLPLMLAKYAFPTCLTCNFVIKSCLPFRKNGLILNIGSFAGEVASPMLATYSGSKAFLVAWSRALAEEYRCKGITVQLVNTFFVVRPPSPSRFIS